MNPTRTDIIDFGESIGIPYEWYENCNPSQEWKNEWFDLLHELGHLAVYPQDLLIQWQEFRKFGKDCQPGYGDSIIPLASTYSSFSMVLDPQEIINRKYFQYFYPNEWSVRVWCGQILEKFGWFVDINNEDYKFNLGGRYGRNKYQWHKAYRVKKEYFDGGHYESISVRELVHAICNDLIYWESGGCLKVFNFSEELIEEVKNRSGESYRDIERNCVKILSLPKIQKIYEIESGVRRFDHCKNPESIKKRELKRWYEKLLSEGSITEHYKSCNIEEFQIINKLIKMLQLWGIDVYAGNYRALESHGEKIKKEVFDDLVIVSSPFFRDYIEPYI